MKFYLLVDEPLSGKTTILKELGYTFVSDTWLGRFSSLRKAIYEGKKKIAIDDYISEGNVGVTVELMWENKKLIYEQMYKEPVYIPPEKYKDVEIVLSTTPIHLNKIGLGLQARCQKVTVEEFKKIKEEEI